jgi:hypothetical protein
LLFFPFLCHFSAGIFCKGGVIDALSAILYVRFLTEDFYKEGLIDVFSAILYVSFLSEDFYKEGLIDAFCFIKNKEPQSDSFIFDYFPLTTLLT